MWAIVCHKSICKTADLKVNVDQLHQVHQENLPGAPCPLVARAATLKQKQAFDLEEAELKVTG